MALLYEHTFMFDCPDCKCPIGTSLISQRTTREVLDMQAIPVHCQNCQKDFKLPGYKAKSHVVNAYNDTQGK
jgi:hypothetical protein